MKKIGREVLFYGADDKCSRMGEGDFLRLRDGRIMYAYTKYGASCGDHDAADIYACYSSDEGDTWGGDRLVLKRDEKSKNYMSITLRRMNNGDAGMFYIRKDQHLDAVVYLVRSEDEGETWSEPVCCNPEDGYFVTNNDRVIRLKDGTWMYPANRHLIQDDGESAWYGTMCILASYDDGKTWKNICNDKDIGIYKDRSGTGLQETGLYEREDGSLWAWSRTDLGYQFESFSYDKGRTWTDPAPNTFFTSPTSPAQIKKVGKYTVAVFNPIPSFKIKEEYFPLDRSPYVCALSTDDGKTFDKMFYLEDDIKNSYCYPALIECEGGFLCAYYHSNNTGINLNSLKITKVLFSETE